MFYHAEVPLRVYEDLVNIEDTNVPETSFDRIIVEWNSLNTTMDMHFISRMNKLRYSAKVNVHDLQNFNQTLLLRGKNFSAYTEVKTNEESFINVPD